MRTEIILVPCGCCDRTFRSFHGSVKPVASGSWGTWEDQRIPWPLTTLHGLLVTSGRLVHAVVKNHVQTRPECALLHIPRVTGNFPRGPRCWRAAPCGCCGGHLFPGFSSIWSCVPCIPRLVAPSSAFKASIFSLTLLPFAPVTWLSSLLAHLSLHLPH